MRRLNVESFSCIDAADLELGNLTVLIGPQASGKSVLAKLVYFFNDLLHAQFFTLRECSDLEEFRQHVKEEFQRLFPSSAWGSKKFTLQYSAGDYQVSISRVTPRKSLNSSNLRVGLSPYFNHQYTESLEAFKAGKEREESDDDLWAMIDLQNNATKAIEKHLGKYYSGRQLFIPAGRSFFTNAGKAFLILEQGKLLDPILIDFGQFFTSWRGRLGYLRRKNNEWFEELNRVLLGGELTIERGEEFLITEDGRKMPFKATSSGQQELLPLVLALCAWGNPEGRKNKPWTRQIMYIEEPEAHLFPSAQSLLVQYLAQTINASQGRRDLFLTTHSPYVLSKLNNLVNAHRIGSMNRGKYAREVAAVVPKKSWVPAESLRAYAIEERVLRSIMDESGLIDAVYLDDVSSQISQEFSALLEIEVGRE